MGHRQPVAKGSKVVAESREWGKEGQGPRRGQCRRKVARAKSPGGRMARHMRYPNPRQQSHSSQRVEAKEGHNKLSSLS